jgi:cytosine/adenosine deaminase-related metal-dependent hydrolase
MADNGDARRVRRNAAQLVEEYLRSGVTQRVFCESHAVASSSFYKALSRYREPSSTLPTPVETAFAAVTIDAPEPERWDVEIELSPSVFIRMRTR